MSKYQKCLLSKFYHFRILILSIMALLLCLSSVFAQNRVFGTSVDPEKYIIGPGDTFQIDFQTEASDQIDVTVTAEGFVLLESIGQADIGGLKLSQAKELISELIEKYYINVDFTISLMGVRPVQILVTGAVVKPGMYDGFVSDRSSEIINKAGGLLPGASNRNIEFRSKFYTNIVDLTKFNRTGDLDANPYLYAGYHLHVPVIMDSAKFVHISGEVVKPGQFELKKGDKISDLIEMAFGLSGMQGDKIILSRNENGGSEEIELSLGDTDKLVQPGDKITISKKRHAFLKDYFTITGEVVTPGVYSYKTGVTCEAVIAMAGGVDQLADLRGIAIYRYAMDVDESLTAPEINLKIGGYSPLVIDRNAIIGNLNSFEILPGDSIHIPKLSGIINVQGLVQNPGILVYSNPISVKAAIDLAGGFSPGADKNKVELIRKSTGVKSVVSKSNSLGDGDIIIAITDEKAKSSLGTIRDYFIILGGAALTYLAIDRMAD